MKRRLFAVSIAAAASAFGALSASAADLPYRDYGHKYGSAYDDPRYADIYGHTPAPPPVQHYEPPHKPYAKYGYDRVPIPREPVYRDDHRNDSYRHDGPRRYAEAHPPYRAYSAGPGCLPKDEVRHELEREGWRDFTDARIIDRGTATVNARRHGRWFELKVDRCSGDVIVARPLDARPYADGGQWWGAPRRTY